MKFAISLVFLLLSVYCKSEDSQKQDLTENAVQKQNSTKPELADHLLVTNNSTVQEHDTKVKQNSIKDEKTEIAAATEAPIIIDGSTYTVPGTEISGNVTVMPPTSVSPTTSTTTVPTTSSTSSTSTTTTVLPPTTPNGTVPTPEPQPQPTASTPPPMHQRGFDGPSFVGGIVLALGLVAIGFVAFKFYKARTELNYHTL